MRRTLPFAIALLLAAGACGPAELVVTVEVDIDEGEGTVTRALPDLEVQLLPYDRDQVFDSMQAAFATPEPEIPQDLIEAREAVQAAQVRWRAAETRWNTLRDTLQKLSEAMQQFNRGEARYVAMFREFQELESQLGRAERENERAFAEFDELQSGTIQRSDSMRIVIDNWADEAFQGVGDVFLLKARASGLQAAADTTDASGVARFEARPGEYWVHVRYELPYTELYWNERVTLVRGEPVELRLTRAQAEERIKL